jgi:hypothetical protein
MNIKGDQKMRKRDVLDVLRLIGWGVFGFFAIIGVETVCRYFASL